MIGRWMSRLLILLLRALSHSPLWLLRALGWALGRVLYALGASRRRVTLTNLRLCFPGLPEPQRRRLAQRTFVHFAQAWLDRGWLWHGSAAVLRRRIELSGADELARGDAPVVLFAPHFVGLDAGWTALTQRIPRSFSTIYTHQSNAVFDAWICAGRKRFGSPALLARSDGTQRLVAGLRSGQLLYLLPDMNFDPAESLFVPFYGVEAATVPSLARFARLARAQVVPVLTRMTAQGYEVQVLPPWSDFPSADLQADTLRMNRELESYIDTMPDQYFWVHKRFKDRPEGAPAVY